MSFSMLKTTQNLEKPLSCSRSSLIFEKCVAWSSVGCSRTKRPKKLKKPTKFLIFLFQVPIFVFGYMDSHIYGVFKKTLLLFTLLCLSVSSISALPHQNKAGNSTGTGQMINSNSVLVALLD
ncbi:hypothetical protein SADUNF_Sadunf04G0142400 [Salix dunnii]|uniref:Uncharacterized protein n=1 Tax=Salix dunnii TaxID=1413687 RepID=A0A835MZK1_9ROSI|nr:hypothetical protein SADUNF_Sadunf04G0142400 [Salix dunnii]